jgi:hypothetical protein
MPSNDPTQRALIAQLAISTRWANTPVEKRRAILAKAQAAFLDRFEREVDPDGVQDPKERAFRAGHARRAYFSRLALKSVQVRKARKQKARAA